MSFKPFLFSIIIVGFTAILFDACRKDEPKDPIISITPTDLITAVNSGDVITFGIQAVSEAPMKSFYITSQLSSSFSKTELDTNLNERTEFKYNFEYLVPDSLSNEYITFAFTVIDVNGNVGDAVRRLFVNIDPITGPDPILLTETSGHEIYSVYSGNTDAFDIETALPQFSLTAPVWELDIADFDTVSTDSMLMHVWESPVGHQFVRFNGFDYANATDISARDGYDAGTPLDIVTNVQIDDILLTDYSGGDNIAVIKITSVIDPDSTNLDRYVFNMKKLAP